MKKIIENLQKEKVEFLKKDINDKFQSINGINFLSWDAGNLEANVAKDLTFLSGSTNSNSFVLITSIEEFKPSINCYISKELVESRGLNASQVVRELGKYIQGGGGGQAHFATAGGKNISGIKEALEKAVDFVK